MAKYLLLVIVILISALFFGFTDPSNLSLGLMMIPAVLLFFGVTIISFIIIDGFLGGTNSKRKKYISVFSGLIFSSVILFYSSGGIGIYEIVLLIMIFIFGGIYILKF